MAALIQATLTPIIAPLIAEQTALRQTVERQAGELGDLRETIGSLTEQVGHRERELTRSSVEIATLSNELQVAEVARWRQARRLTLAVVVLVVLLVLMLAAPVWVR